MPRQIGIYGGSFNPPHIAHLIIAETIRDQFGLDLIFWVPNYTAPHKSPKEFAKASHRLQMTRLTVQSNDAFVVSSLEIDRGGISYTVDTVNHLQRSHPDDIFHFLMGEDSLNDFMQWRSPEQIINRVPLIVYKRFPSRTSTSEVESLYPNRIAFADAPLLEISSSTIRRRIQAHQSVRYLLPNSVLSYIQLHNLYT